MNAQTLDPVAVESLLAFWAEAGVDACFEDAAVDRTYVPPPVQKAVVRATASVAVVPDSDEAVREARRLAADCATLEALGKAVAGFEGCPLTTLGARRAVFARGPAEAPLMVIGHAPSGGDEARGAPFVDTAGELLDKMLAAIGVGDRAWVTNTVFWRPPGDRVPTPDEQAVCRPFLERALVLLKPRAVLLLGACAARGVTGAEENIVRLRGSWRDWRLAEGDVEVPTLTTFHPVFLERQPQAKRAAWEDLQALRARLAQGQPQS